MFISSMYRLRFVVVAILTYTCGIMDLGSGHGGGGSLSFFVNAEFGDYADLSYDCPYITTCRTICVTNITECPAELQCAGGEEVCLDGRCSDDCETTGREIWGDYWGGNRYDDIESPCVTETYPVQCASAQGTIEECNEWYSGYHEYEDYYFTDMYYYWSYYNQYYYTYYNILEPVSWTEEWLFVFFYAWMGGLTFLITVWNILNSFSNSPRTRKPLEFEVSLQSSSSRHDNSVTKKTSEADKLIDELKVQEGIQMGYDGGWITNCVGRLLYVLSLFTMVGFFAILTWLTINYYQIQDPTAKVVLHLNNENRFFQQEEQCLQAFVVVLGIGFVWTILFKWNYNIESIFFRRSRLGTATHVAVYYNDKTEADRFKNMSSAVKYSVALLDFLMGLIWWDFEQYHRKGGLYEFCPVKKDTDGSRYFVFKFRRYNYSKEDDCFKAASYNVGTTIGELIEAGNKTGGLTNQEVQDRRRVVGRNAIEMEEPFYPYVFLEEANNPWYLYQFYLIFTWTPLYYYYMALTYTEVVLLAIIGASVFRYVSLSTLYQLTAQTGSAKVLRNGSFERVHPKELVPGDVIQVEAGLSHMDMVIISDGRCLVDESALTGEANPKAKVALDATTKTEEYDAKAHKRQTISAGTTIVEAEEDLKALVIKTGSNTSRGQLLQDIFSQQRHQFKFDSQVYTVFFILLIYAAVGFGITFAFIKGSWATQSFFGFYVIAGAVPVLLPTVFTWAVWVSGSRLKAKKIACVNSESILVAGKVRRAFFDKTGTLTHQGLTFKSARSASEWKNSAFNFFQDTSSVPKDMQTIMATCHSLHRSTITGDLVGNPVDINMFEATGAKLLDSQGGNVTIKDKEGIEMVVLKAFDFDHQRMTQSCIVQNKDNSLVVYVKGSGESIKELCRQSSLPDDFDFALRQSARLGIYQISMAMKELPEGTDFKNLTRDEVEKDLSFVGVINFKNTMREETPNVIAQLADGDIMSHMVTGDNVLTGISIAKESGIIGGGPIVLVGGVDDTGKIFWTNESDVLVPQPTISELNDGGIVLAVYGAAWRKLLYEDPSHAFKLGEYIRVYGRCTPLDKMSVVSTFADNGYVTCMCGDGANDSGALKTAHVGIALSDAEASLVAPFASLDKSIESVLDVMKEGRCCLASSFTSYKYMIMYGQIIVLNQVATAYYQVTFADISWIALDFIWPITLAVALALSKRADKLAKTRPTASILSYQTVGSVLGQVVINLAFTTVAIFALLDQDWYQCRKWGGEEINNVLVISDNYEAEVIYFVTGFQMISAAMSFNFGYEFRQGWFKNYVFILFASCYTFMHFYTLFVPSRISCMFRLNCMNEDIEWRDIWKPQPIQNDWNHTVMPIEFRWLLAFMIVSNTLALLAWEYLIVNGIRRKAASAKYKEDWI